MNRKIEDSLLAEVTASVLILQQTFHAHSVHLVKHIRRQQKPDKLANHRSDHIDGQVESPWMTLRLPRETTRNTTNQLFTRVLESYGLHRYSIKYHIILVAILPISKKLLSKARAQRYHSTTPIQENLE